MSEDIRRLYNASEKEKSSREQFYDLYRQAPIASDEILANLGLFLKRQDLSEILFITELYKQIVGIHGVIMEFGVRWGRNLALLQSLRGIFEPYNHNRKIIGFDTFSGFPSVDSKDGKSSIIHEGAYSVTENYDEYLEQVLSYHETESPIGHIKKFELRKGDGTKELVKYLDENPQTIISMAYFDFDLYEPTKICLEKVLEHTTKGSLIAFDQLNHKDYPGETLALKEVLGLDSRTIHKSPLSPTQSYIII